MKYYLFCIQFFLLVSIGISQNTGAKIYTVTKQKASNVKSFNEIIPDFPKSVSWFSMELVVNVGGKHGKKMYKGNNINGINLSFLSQAKINSFIFLSMKYKVENGEVFYRKYKIKVTE